jgi:hypothetical protein
LRRLIALVLLLAAAPAASAPNPEQTYLAAHDHAVAALKKMSGKKQEAEEGRLRAALEKQLQALINPPPLGGFAGPAATSPETLLADDIGFDSLDGLVLRSKDDSGEVLVTTDGLLRSWLLAHKGLWKDEANPPAEPEAAFRSETFYTQAASPDAAVSIFASLPIRKPDGAATAIAFLVQESQDVATEPPEQIAVAVAKSGKIFIAIVKADVKPAPIAACTAVWNDFESRSQAALKKYDDSNLKDEKSFDASTKLEQQGEAAFHKCWFEKANATPEFSALTKQAQALADLFASH